MKTWWLVAAAAALVAVWWLRRGKAALEGTAKTTSAPAGASSVGVLAALQAVPKPPTYKQPQPKVALRPVGLGTVTLGQGTVGPEKSVRAPTVQPPKPRLNLLR